MFDRSRSSSFVRPGGVLLLLALAAGAAPAEEQRVAVPRFRSGVDLVKVTATVRDAEGRLVGDLTRDDFEVFEDGRPQRITQFDRGRVPVSLGVVLDVSQSMLGQRMDDARAALRRFLVDLLEPGDEVFLMVFNHDPKLEAPWTLGPSRLRGRLDRVRPYGATAIYDALMMALPMFAVRAHDRAAVVLISDGSDTASDVTREDVRWQIRLSDAFVYAIGIDAPERRPINDRVNARLLRDVTAESGGYAEVISDSPELAPATERIAEELNHQYTLAYAPTRPPDRRYRRIQVRVRGGEHQVRARRGYVALPRR
ncbi:MAG: VWA domain-containing protein [Acidobacteriota bacterium]|nr:VWA domain-containing protein [Acidobacteriota bacterium]